MPKKVEEIVKALLDKGMDKSKAYAIATAKYKMMKSKKKGK